MKNIVFRMKNFIIIKQYEDKFMVVNLDKEFKHGHTHTTNLQYAKLMVIVIIEQKVKNKRHKRLLKNNHFIESLIRLTSEHEVNEIIEKSS